MVASASNCEGVFPDRQTPPRRVRRPVAARPLGLVAHEDALRNRLDRDRGAHQIDRLPEGRETSLGRLDRNESRLGEERSTEAAPFWPREEGAIRLATDG